jgi:hypothetical protein
MLSDIVLPLCQFGTLHSCHYFTSQGFRRSAIPSRAGVRRTRMLPHVKDLLTCLLILPCLTAVKTRGCRLWFPRRLKALSLVSTVGNGNLEEVGNSEEVGISEVASLMPLPTVVASELQSPTVATSRLPTSTFRLDLKIRGYQCPASGEVFKYLRT